MIDNGSRVSDSLLSRRIRQMMALDPSATAMFFDGLAFPWSFYSDAVTDLQSLLAGHPAARRVGIVLRNRPGPLAALIATIGTGREVVTLSPHLGDIGLERDIADLAPDVIVAEDEDWARDAVLRLVEDGRRDRAADRSRPGPGRAARRVVTESGTAAPRRYRRADDDKRHDRAAEAGRADVRPDDRGVPRGRAGLRRGA